MTRLSGERCVRLVVGSLDDTNAEWLVLVVGSFFIYSKSTRLVRKAKYCIQ